MPRRRYILHTAAVAAAVLATAGTATAAGTTNWIGAGDNSPDSSSPPHIVRAPR